MLHRRMRVHTNPTNSDTQVKNRSYDSTHLVLSVVRIAADQSSLRLKSNSEARLFRVPKEHDGNLDLTASQRLVDFSSLVTK